MDRITEQRAMQKRVIMALVALAVAVALISSLPYGYYSVMCWLVFASCAWLAIDSYRNGSEGWAWIWGVIAGIYNPLFPVHASRAIWSVVNIGVIAAVLWCWLKDLRRR